MKSFQEIVPLWSKKLREVGGISKVKEVDYFVGRKKLSIGDPQYCIIGEAHGFSDRYETSCEVCGYLCMELFRCSPRAIQYDPQKKHEMQKRFNNLKRQFVRHFNKVHLKRRKK